MCGRERSVLTLRLRLRLHVPSTQQSGPSETTQSETSATHAWRIYVYDGSKRNIRGWINTVSAFHFIGLDKWIVPMLAESVLNTASLRDNRLGLSKPAAAAAITLCQINNAITQIISISVIWRALRTYTCTNVYNYVSMYVPTYVHACKHAIIGT